MTNSRVDVLPLSRLLQRHQILKRAAWVGVVFPYFAGVVEGISASATNTEQIDAASFLIVVATVIAIAAYPVCALHKRFLNRRTQRHRRSIGLAEGSPFKAVAPKIVRGPRLLIVLALWSLRCAWFAFAWWVANATVWVAEIFKSDAVSLVALAWALWGAGTWLLGDSWLSRRIRSYAAMRYYQEKKYDRRKPVVLFRAFKDDGQLNIREKWRLRNFVFWPLWQSIPLEQVIARTAWSAGPVVALANPGAGRDPGHAAREGVPQGEDWKLTVERLVQDAAFIIVIAGYTPNIAWELTHLAERNRLQDTIVVLPSPDLNAVNRWADLKADMRVSNYLPDLDESFRTLAVKLGASGSLVAIGRRRDEVEYEAALRILMTPPARPL